TGPGRTDNARPDHARPDNARPAVVVALPDPERSEVVAGLQEAGFDPIPLPNGASLADAFGPKTPSIIAIVDVGGDPAGAMARVRTARRGRPAGALAVVYSVTDSELDGLAADLGEDEVILRPWPVEAVRWVTEPTAIRAVAPTTENGDQVLCGG